MRSEERVLRSTRKGAVAQTNSNMVVYLMSLLRAREREKKRAGEHQNSRTGHVSFLCFSSFNEGKLIASSPSAKGTQAPLFSLSKRAG